MSFCAWVDYDKLQGVGVSSDGRIFTCFPRGNETFTLGEANSSTTEAPFPKYVLLVATMICALLIALPI